MWLVRKMKGIKRKGKRESRILDRLMMARIRPATEIKKRE